MVNLSRLKLWMAVAACAAVGLGQQGHPLTGTWNGDWGPSSANRTQLTVVMSWDGKVVSGVINPGPDSSMAAVTLDAPNWMVRIDGDIKDKSGKMVHVSAEGKLEDPGAYHRYITGTWRQGTASGTFKLVRD
jgi:hypothetical protein